MLKASRVISAGAGSALGKTNLMGPLTPVATFTITSVPNTQKMSDRNRPA